MKVSEIYLLILGDKTKPCNSNILVRYNFTKTALASISVCLTCFVYLVTDGV